MYACSNKEEDVIRLGMKAPEFKANTTFGPIKLSDYKGQWLIFFSHPGDFTPVCTTEFLAFSKYYPMFKQNNTELLGLSIDSNASHLAWVYDIYKNTGVQIPFPIVEDRDGSIARMYGMISEDVSEAKTVRNTFIIDDKGIVRAILIYPLTNGRCIQEVFRLLLALQKSDKDNVATPANWVPGMPVIVPPPQTYNELMNRVNNPGNLQCVNWYLCYKR